MATGFSAVSYRILTRTLVLAHDLVARFLICNVKAWRRWRSHAIRDAFNRSIEAVAVNLHSSTSAAETANHGDRPSMDASIDVANAFVNDHVRSWRHNGKPKLSVVHCALDSDSAFTYKDHQPAPIDLRRLVPWNKIVEIPIAHCGIAFSVASALVNNPDTLAVGCSLLHRRRKIYVLPKINGKVHTLGDTTLPIESRAGSELPDE